MAQPRPAEVLNALKRLGYLDKPASGDHIRLFKLIADHPEGQITIQTGIDMGTSPCHKHDIGKIRDQTKLKGDRWEQALAKKLPRAEYDQYLKGLPKAELVPHFWRHRFEKKKPKG